MSQAAQLGEAFRKPGETKYQASDTHHLELPMAKSQPPLRGGTYLDRGFPLKSAISRALQNFMLSGISGISVCGEGVCHEVGTPQELPRAPIPLSHRVPPWPACLPFRDTSNSTSCIKLATSGGRRWISLSLRPNFRKFNSRKKGCG